MTEKNKWDPLYDLDVNEIQQYQQNRYPILFLDYVTEAIPGKSAKGYKNFSFNEWFFPSHFPDEPNVPGFIQIEALTQLFLMTFLTIPEHKGKKTGYASVDGAKFKRKIIPGDVLQMEATLNSFRRGVAKGEVVGYVKGEQACSITLTVVIPDVLNCFKPKSK